MIFRTPTRRLALAFAVAALGTACQSRMPLPPPSVEPPVQPPPVDPTACDACHGAPPATGAHLLHSAAALRPGLAYGDLAVLEDFATGGTAYGFGCGNCHPLDPALHLVDAGGDGLPDVELAPPTDGSAAGSLRARNSPYAKWDPATGTCNGVYCHSSGQDVPAYVETPPWTAPPGTLGCDGCHGNPPRYPSAGAESAAPNSHVQLADDGWEWGHFASMPGAWHPGGPLHGSATGAAAPITCQTCHADTVDPAQTAPGGFFYLDTSGDYALPGGAPGRLTNAFWTAIVRCTTCHDGVLAPLGTGKVLPLRHVNGRRDVVFDTRTALPSGYATGLPPLASTAAIAPYYVAPFNADVSGYALPSGTELRTATNGSIVLTVNLTAAAYDPSTRTCTNVACHLARQAQVDTGVPLIDPLRWGAPYLYDTSCNGCHPKW